MHYLDLILGETYLYHGQKVLLYGTRIVTHVGSGLDETFATIEYPDGRRVQVHPHDLRALPRPTT